MIIRISETDDIPEMNRIMNEAIASLMTPFLAPEQIEASYEFMGLDTQLVEDKTYFICEAAGDIIGCGGWSRRATLFGGDHTVGRDSEFLDPAKDAARVRAMYTDPKHVRRGVGRRILDACEQAARKEGFLRAELAATLAGEPLYRKCGYRPIKEFVATSSTGVDVPLILMGKPLAQ